MEGGERPQCRYRLWNNHTILNTLVYQAIIKIDLKKGAELPDKKLSHGQSVEFLTLQFTFESKTFHLEISYTRKSDLINWILGTKVRIGEKKVLKNERACMDMKTEKAQKQDQDGTIATKLNKLLPHNKPTKVKAKHKEAIYI